MPSSATNIRSDGLRPERRRCHVGRRDAELLHLREERRALQAETDRRATWTGDDAVCLAKHLEDVLADRVLERLPVRRRRPYGLRRRFEGRELQAVAARQDDGSMDDVLQLADVSGPR